MSTPDVSKTLSTSVRPTVTIDEFVESLTGFDEIAIEKNFDGFDVYTQAETKSIRAMRAMAFVQFRREGQTDRDAFKAAQSLPLKDLQAMWITAAPEIDPDNPDTESGKDSEPLD